MSKKNDFENYAHFSLKRKIYSEHTSHDKQFHNNDNEEYIDDDDDGSDNDNKHCDDDSGDNDNNNNDDDEKANSSAKFSIIEGLRWQQL